MRAYTLCSKIIGSRIYFHCLFLLEVLLTSEVSNTHIYSYTHLGKMKLTKRHELKILYVNFLKRKFSFNKLEHKIDNYNKIQFINLIHYPNTDNSFNNTSKYKNIIN